MFSYFIIIIPFYSLPYLISNSFHLLHTPCFKSTRLRHSQELPVPQSTDFPSNSIHDPSNSFPIHTEPSQGGETGSRYARSLGFFDEPMWATSNSNSELNNIGKNGHDQDEQSVNVNVEKKAEKSRKKVQNRMVYYMITYSSSFLAGQYED